jgi:hypothetical protein
MHERLVVRTKIGPRTGDAKAAISRLVGTHVLATRIQPGDEKFLDVVVASLRYVLEGLSLEYVDARWDQVVHMTMPVPGRALPNNRCHRAGLGMRIEKMAKIHPGNQCAVSGHHRLGTIVGDRISQTSCRTSR